MQASHPQPFALLSLRVDLHRESQLAPCKQSEHRKTLRELKQRGKDESLFQKSSIRTQLTS